MNQWLLGCRNSGEAALIDAGDHEPQAWVEAAAADGLTIRHVLLTHGHVDHVAGLAPTKALLPDAAVYLHPDDALTLRSAPAQGMMFGMACATPPDSDVELADSTTIRVGELAVEVLHTPGHSPGHCVFHLQEHGLLFGVCAWHG